MLEPEKRETSANELSLAQINFARPLPEFENRVERALDVEGFRRNVDYTRAIFNPKEHETIVFGIESRDIAARMIEPLLGAGGEVSSVQIVKLGSGYSTQVFYEN